MWNGTNEIVMVTLIRNKWFKKWVSCTRELLCEDEVEDDMRFFSMLIRAGRVSGAYSRSIRGSRSMIQ